MKKLLAAIMVTVALGLSAMAQDTTPSPPPTIVGIGSQLTEYLLSHGTVGTGYGTELAMKQEDRGVMMNYSLDTPLGVHVGKFEAKLALDYDITFSSPVARQHLGLGLPIYHYSVPPWAAAVLNTPKDTLASGPAPAQGVGAVLPNLADWKLQPVVGLRPDDIYGMRYAYDRIFIGLEFTVGFK